MASLNKVMLIGNLGQDPKIHNGQYGKMATASLATSYSYKDKNGQQQTKTEWHNLSFKFENLANVVERYCHKGTPIYVEGRIETRKYQDKNGNERYATDIVVSNMQLLGRSQEEEEQKKDPEPQYDGEDVPF